MMKISIVTPSYNQGQFIERTIQSIKTQKSNGFVVEHIVFDACSTDDTISILKRYGSSVNWMSEKDNGQAHAVNKGFLKAKGDILGWLNSDDTYEPNALQIVADYFKNHSDVDIIYGEANHIDIDDNFIETYPTEEWSPERLKERCFICQPSVFFRKSVFDNYEGLDVELQYCMDYEFWLRLAENGKKFVKINQVLSNSRLYAENKTLGDRVKVHKEICAMFYKMYRSVPNKWIYNLAHAQADDLNLLPSRIRVLKIVFFTICASLYWNRTLQSNMRLQLVSWLKDSLRVRQND